MLTRKSPYFAHKNTTMLNWRTILGLILILLGVKGLYMVYYQPGSLNSSISPAYVGIGCVVWALVGMFLLVQGTKKKDTTL